jgi:TRAP-type C4-dicarboxylate transport system permease small subunit
MLYALWLFLQGSWAQTLIGLGTYSTVLHMPNAFMASAGLVCAASMLVIVAVNLLRILANHPLAMVPGELRPGTPSPAAVPAEAAE